MRSPFQVEGEDLSELTPNDATLLATMISTIAVIWSIGLVAFFFLVGRLLAWREAGSNSSSEPAMQPPSPASTVGQVIDMILRYPFRLAGMVVSGMIRLAEEFMRKALLAFMVATVLAFVSIMASFAVFAINSREILPLAWFLFVVSISALFGISLFVYWAAMSEAIPPPV